MVEANWANSSSTLHTVCCQNGAFYKKPTKAQTVGSRDKLCQIWRHYSNVSLRNPKWANTMASKSYISRSRSPKIECPMVDTSHALWTAYWWHIQNTYKRNTTKRLNRAASFPLYLYAPMNSRYHDVLKSFIKHLHLCGSFHCYHFSPVQSSIHLYQLSREPEVTQHHKSSLHMLSGPHAILPTGELSRTLIDMTRSPPLMLFSNFP